jgi:hypothetical protein
MRGMRASLIQSRQMLLFLLVLFVMTVLFIIISEILK